MKPRLFFVLFAAALPLLALVYRARQEQTRLVQSGALTSTQNAGANRGTAPVQNVAIAPTQSLAVAPPPGVALTKRISLATPTPTPKKVQLKVVVTATAKPIPAHVLSAKEAHDLRWPWTSFRLFYKKNFKSTGIGNEPKLIIHKAWYQALPSSSWSEAPKKLIEKCNIQLLPMGGEPNESNGNVTGFVFDDPPPGTWRFDAEVVVEFAPDFFAHPDLNLEGHARFMTIVTTPQSETLGNPVELHSAWIDHLEWAPTLQGPWKRVPEPGKQGFPLHVKQPLNIFLRAVKKYPRDPWPTEGFDNQNTGERLPVWEGRYWNTRIERDFLSNPSDDIMHLEKSALSWLNFDRVAKGTGIVASSDNAHLLTIIARAGSNKSAQLWIDPLA